MTSDEVERLAFAIAFWAEERSVEEWRESARELLVALKEARAAARELRDVAASMGAKVHHYNRAWPWLKEPPG